MYVYIANLHLKNRMKFLFVLKKKKKLKRISYCRLKLKHERYNTKCWFYRKKNAYTCIYCI